MKRGRYRLPLLSDCIFTMLPFIVCSLYSHHGEELQALADICMPFIIDSHIDLPCCIHASP